MADNNIIVRRFRDLQDYETIWRSMQDFTRQRDAINNKNISDEIWLLQHHPVFTLGQAGKTEHLLYPQSSANNDIPLVKSDRGGQITYHGPGQLIAYLLLDIKSRQLGVRQLVTLMEQSLVDLLQEFGIESYAKKSAPGVYVQRKIGNQLVEHKIAALGLRVKKGCSYHGLALNVDMDLAPFRQINPCGYAGLAVTQMVDLLPKKPDSHDIESRLLQQLAKKLNAKLIESTPTP
jgi:lipoyl(octanoyl) transferase